MLVLVVVVIDIVVVVVDFVALEPPPLQHHIFPLLSMRRSFVTPRTDADSDTNLNFATSSTSLYSDTFER